MFLPLVLLVVSAGLGEIQSTQAGLTGLKGGIVRRVAVDKTRSSLERALASLKQKLEGQAK